MTTATGATTGSDSCLSEHLKLALGRPEGAAGSSYYTLVFTNTGSTTCTLQGFPGVSYVTGDSGQQVGAAAAWDHAQGNGDLVSLTPGGSAYTTVQEVDVQNFPANACDPVATRGLRIYPPGEKAALFVAQTGLGCSAKTLPGGQFQLSVQALQPGTGAGN